MGVFGLPGYVLDIQNLTITTYGSSTYRRKNIKTAYLVWIFVQVEILEELRYESTVDEIMSGVDCSQTPV